MRVPSQPSSRGVISSSASTGPWPGPLLPCPPLLLLPSQAPSAAPPWLQAGFCLVTILASKVLAQNSVPQRPMLKDLPKLMGLWGLLLQPAYPCVLATTIHIRPRNSHRLPLFQPQFGEDVVDKGPKPHHCICHCCFLPRIFSKPPLEGDLGEELINERPVKALGLGNREAAGKLSSMGVRALARVFL